MAATSEPFSGDIMGIYANGTLVAHATDSSLSVSMDVIDTTEKDSNKWTEHIRGNRGWEISGNSLEVFASSMSVEQLIDFLINAESVSVRFRTTLNEVFYVGSVSVTSTSFAAPQNAPASFDFTFAGNGELLNASTPIYNSDFSAGVDGFSNTNLTITGNNDSIGGEDDWLKGVLTGGNTQHFASRSSTYTIGESYLITGKAFVPSANTKVDGITVWDGLTRHFIPVTSNTVVEFEQEVLSVTQVQFRIHASDGGVETSLDADGDIFYVKDIIIRRIA